MNMDVDSPTQHAPIHVDIHSYYRVTFDNMKYQSVKKHWEISVKLEDTSAEKIVGETQILWPHSDPPHTIIYDSERKLLHWENNESLAYLPLRIPSRPAYDPGASNAVRINPKLLIRPPLSTDDRSAAKILRETPWKELIESRSFLRKNKQYFESIEHDFNPLFEERLPVDEQKRALKAFAENYHLDGMRELLQRLLKMRFFELSALNAFIAEYYAPTKSAVGHVCPPPDEDDDNFGNGTNGHHHAHHHHQNGSSATNGHASSTHRLVTNNAADDENGFLRALVSNPQVLLTDNSYVALLRCAARKKARAVRRLLATKNMPLDDALRHRIITELELGTIVYLINHYVHEFVLSGNESATTLGNVLDLLLFLSHGIDDKILWLTPAKKQTYNKTILPALHALKLVNNMPLELIKLVSVNKLHKSIGHLPPPQNDYRRRPVTFYVTTIQH